MPDVTELERIAELRGRVGGQLALLGLDELAAIELVIAGVVRGRQVYGELCINSDARDFAAETREELRDALVYSAAALLRLNRGGRRA